MTHDELIAELRRRVDEMKSDEEKIVENWKLVTPAWATYFRGYRDAISEVIEVLEKEKINAK